MRSARFKRISVGAGMIRPLWCGRRAEMGVRGGRANSELDNESELRRLLRLG
jgi:hypothetical protein